MLATDIKETRPMSVAEKNCFSDENTKMKLLMGAKSEKLTCQLLRSITTNVD